MGWIIYFIGVVFFFGIFLSSLEKKHGELTAPMLVAATFAAIFWFLMLIASIGYGISKKL